MSDVFQMCVFVRHLTEDERVEVGFYSHAAHMTCSHSVLISKGKAQTDGGECMASVDTEAPAGRL